jgi:hypothetical protein
MLHMAIEPFTDANLVDRPRSPQALPEVAVPSTRNGIVKEFVAVDLLTFPTERSGWDRHLLKAVFSSNAHLGKSSSGLSRNDNSNRVCEAIRADALVKHIPPDFAKVVCKSQFLV